MVYNQVMLVTLFSLLWWSCLMWTTQGQQQQQLGGGPKTSAAAAQEAVVNHPTKDEAELASLWLEDGFVYEYDNPRHQKEMNEIIEKIVSGSATMGSSSSQLGYNRFLQDNDDPTQPNLAPNCTAPPPQETDSDMRSNIAYDNTTNTTAAPPKMTNFSGIILLQLVGRPLDAARNNETSIMEQAVLEIYQNLSDCAQSGVMRDLRRVEIVPDLFGAASSSLGTGDNITSGGDDDGSNTTTTNGTTTSDGSPQERRRLDRFFWKDDTNDDDSISLESWKKMNPNEQFEWNRQRYLQLVDDGISPDSSSPIGIFDNNNTNNNNTGRPPFQQQQPQITQPFNWLARLSGACNGCALQEELFDDTNRVQRRARHLLVVDSSHPHRSLIENTTATDNSTLSMENTTDTDIDTASTDPESEPEYCDCPGPTNDLFQQVLNDTVQELIASGVLETIDAITNTPELIRQPETCIGNEDQLETFHTEFIITVRGCPTMFNPPEGLAALERMALASTRSFNERNLLNGGLNCDPFARRMINATSTVLQPVPEEEGNGISDCSNGQSGEIISILLNITVECIGCNGIIFELDEEVEGGNIRRHLQRLQVDTKPNLDLFPFCFCPIGAPFKGITTSDFLRAFQESRFIRLLEVGGEGGDLPVGFDEVVGVTEVFCGNGILDIGEECDDGNTVDGDGCTNGCTVAFCGDGVLALDIEECDDGNDIDTDECSNSCVLAASPSSTPGPTAGPTLGPSVGPSASPSLSPSGGPTASPSDSPTGGPITSSSVSPTGNPIASPSDSPTGGPTASPSVSPTGEPTASPSASPTGSPTASPSASPTGRPTASPSASPTGSPTSSPSIGPSASPTAGPTDGPTFLPTSSPSSEPTLRSTPAPICGNGVLEDGEDCDDGNTVDADGCSSECLRNPVCLSDGTVDLQLGDNLLDTPCSNEQIAWRFCHQLVSSNDYASFCVCVADVALQHILSIEGRTTTVADILNDVEECNPGCTPNYGTNDSDDQDYCGCRNEQVEDLLCGSSVNDVNNVAYCECRRDDVLPVVNDACGRDIAFGDIGYSNLPELTSFCEGILANPDCQDDDYCLCSPEQAVVLDCGWLDGEVSWCNCVVRSLDDLYFDCGLDFYFEDIYPRGSDEFQFCFE